MIVALTALSTATIFELLLTWRNHGFRKIKDGSAAATAMVLAILLPNTIHPVYAALGSLFAIIVVKYSFGGLGSNWLNPALGGWIFIRFSWPSAFAKALEGSPFSGTGVLYLGSESASPLGTSVASFLNKTVFTVTGAELPPGYIDLFFLKDSGIIADRGLFVLLIGTIILTSFRISRSWVPAVFLAVFGFLVKYSGGISLTGQYWNGDMLFGLLSGSTIAAAFILAAEPASGAKTKTGMLAATIIGAVLSWLFRYISLEYSGCFIALALVNCLTPLIRLFESKMFLSRKGLYSEGAK